MKILVVTARKAMPIVEKAIGQFINVQVKTLNLDIAAFTTPKLLREALAGEKQKYDLIIVSGLCGADFSRLERDINAKIRLGPKHASDLGIVIKYADKIEFSSKIPACALIAGMIKKDALQKIAELEQKANCNFQIRHLKIGLNSRMKVLAEIVDATRIGSEALLKKTKYFAGEGADMIDLGVHLEATPGDVERAVKAVKPLGLPVSIDTLDGELIKAGVKAGAALVLSLNSANLKIAGKVIAASNSAAVIIPDGEDIKTLRSNIEQAKAIGIKKIIADPILNPIAHGCIESIARYHQFRALDRETALFFGTGNVTELIDADSAGASAVLAGLAMELNASILFTPEHSDKARGNVRELRIASEMMLLAREKQTPPKDLGIDLLGIKEKRARTGTLDIREVKRVIAAEKSRIWKLDPVGCFKIGLVEFDGEEVIVAVHEPEKIAIKGKTAKEIMDTIIKQKLVSSTEHAAYLGRELMKAELALRFRRSYAQDDEF